MCLIAECDRRVAAFGLCDLHYRRKRRYGDPLISRPWGGRKAGDPLIRFLSKIHKTDECWLWTGAPGSHGYGTFKVRPGEGHQKAHRLAYEIFVGPIPDGLYIDHLCHNRDLTCPGGNSCPHRLCVNPDHLEAVTHAENSRRGRTGKYQRAPRVVRTHCVNGHEMTAENTYIESVRGYHTCKACSRAAVRRHRTRARSVM